MYLRVRQWESSPRCCPGQFRCPATEKAVRTEAPDETEGFQPSGRSLVEIRQEADPQESCSGQVEPLAGFHDNAGWGGQGESR